MPGPDCNGGGPKCETEMEAFEFVHDGMQRGAIGVNLGRNIWQHAYPVPMMKSLRAIIHEGATLKDAQGIFDDEKKNY